MKKHSYKIILSIFILIIIFIPPSISYTEVYITNTGNKYHTSGCRYLRKSKIPIDINDAVKRGYTACSRCSASSISVDYSLSSSNINEKKSSSSQISKTTQSENPTNNNKANNNLSSIAILGGTGFLVYLLNKNSKKPKS